MAEIGKSVPKQTVKRLPNYLTFLKDAQQDGVVNISAPYVAKGLNLNEVQVRKDLAAVSNSGGKPRMGYLLSDLISDIESYLGYDNVTDAILVGVGHLGSALLSFKGFTGYGLNVVAGFDTDKDIVGTEVHGKMIFDVNRISELTQRLNIHLGIITVPDEYAQEVCNLMVSAGILSIWNFAQVHLKVPTNVTVKNENLAASLASLSRSINIEQIEAEI